jgi:hypothetical protein
MGLVNQTLPGLYNGVSQQPDELRLDTQVSEMINCYPSLVEGTQKRLPAALIHTDTADTNSIAMGDDVFIHTYDRGVGSERYILVVKDGYWRSYDADTGLPVQTMDWQSDAYLALPAGAKASESFSMVTVGDTTYIVNKTKTTAMSATTDDNGDPSWDKNFYYWVKRTTEIRYGTDANSSKGYTYYIYNNAGTIVGNVEDSDSVLIATALASAIGGASSQGSVVKRTSAGTDVYTGSDSWGSQASESWQGTVKKMQDLPNDLGYLGAVIEVSGDDANSFDNFYVKFDGTYKETFRPGLANDFDATTMPHIIERQGGGNFTMTPVAYVSRKVGDIDTAPEPTFIGKGITDVFFYKNRLGFLSGDNIIMSETGEYYNFFPTTVTDVLDSDPIDVAVDSNKAVHLNYALPFNKELLIFGDHAQFILSASKALSPKDINIQQSTAYSINTKVTPITLGPNVYFVTDKQNSSIVREYYVVPDTANNTAANITSHCPSYIPDGLIKLAGSEKHDMLFGITGTDNKIYVYNFYWQGEEKAQSAWHTWTIESDEVIFSVEVLGSKLLVMVAYPNGDKVLETIDLELPKDITTIDYQDDGTDPVESRIEMSKWGVPSGQSNVDSNRASLILRDLRLSMGVNSYYGVEVTRGAVVNTWLNYETTGMTFIGDHKYPVVGNANNLDIAIVNTTNKGFKLNSLSWRGQLHLKGSRGI